MRLIYNLCLLFFALNFTSCAERQPSQLPTAKTDFCNIYPCVHGGIIRGDTTQKKLALVFTGDEFADGGQLIRSVLKNQQVKGAFFLTGNFYENPDFSAILKALVSDGHYLGAHSNRHLLYCTWENRDSLLVSKEAFFKDLDDNYKQMARFGIQKEDAPYFLPPYEWYNDSISTWTRDYGLQLINYSPGTISHADYTTPDMPNYRSSEVIYQSILDFENKELNGLNGFILLSHIGTYPTRTDQFYDRLEELIVWLKGKEYEFVGVDELLEPERINK